MGSYDHEVRCSHAVQFKYRNVASHFDSSSTLGANTDIYSLISLEMNPNQIHLYRYFYNRKAKDLCVRIVCTSLAATPASCCSMFVCFGA